MKATLQNVLIGAAVILAVVYILRPSTFGGEGFAGNPWDDKSAGSILGMVFAGILGVGIVFAFFAGLGEVGRS